MMQDLHHPNISVLHVESHDIFSQKLFCGRIKLFLFFRSNDYRKTPKEHFISPSGATVQVSHKPSRRHELEK